MDLPQEYQHASLDDNYQWGSPYLAPQLGDISWENIPLGGHIDLFRLCACQLLHPHY